MTSHFSRAAVSLFSLSAALATSTIAHAQSRQVTTPNVTTTAGSVAVTLNGTVFTNQGLVGAGRLSANTRDFNGETLGSFSGMALNLATWRRNADGSYVGGITTLPDRGPNDVGPFVGSTDYKNRVHYSTITFRPYTGTADLPQSTASQSQVTITPTGGTFLTDSTGAIFTGKDPGTGTVTRDGIVYPMPLSGEGAGRISLDAEAIAYLPNGNFYISDEYAAGIYYFDATGRQIGAIQTVPALLPVTAGATNFNSVTPGTSGRRNNQGLEALSITPDQRRLVTILQSATVQDTNGAAQQTRNNTRVLVYDITGTRTPTNPIGHYVLQLPIFNQDGAGAPNRTAAQSEMLALNDSQFLVLSRDGIGRGAVPGAGNTAVFKSILLVDTTGATNLVGTAYETGTTPIATAGTLASGIVPVQQVELVNMLNATQLNRFGMNLNTRPSSQTSLGEKWEAMALAPVLEEGAPQDYFLFVGNDNDFQASNGFINGQAYDASISGVGGTGTNDSVLLVYRLTLPTYVDPMALAALNATAPAILYGTRTTMNALGTSTTQPAMRFLNGQRGWGAEASARRPQLWLDNEWQHVGGGIPQQQGYRASMLNMTVGFDMPVGTSARVGVTGGYRSFDGRIASGMPLEGDAWTAGVYAAIELPTGLYAQASAAWLGNAKFKQLRRNSAYGQQATGDTKGDGWAASGEAGWAFALGKASVTPFVALDYTDLTLDGYTETGASVSNLAYAKREFRKLTTSVGGELATRFGAFRPALRGGYSMEKETGDDRATVRLAAAQHSMATVAVPLADTERDSAFGEARLAFQQGPVSGYLSARGRWGRGEDDRRVNVGIGYSF